MKKAGQKTAAPSLKSMNVKFICFWGAAAAIPFFACWSVPQPSYATRPAAPNQTRSPSPADDNGALLRQLRTTLADLKNEVHNHEAEIRTFENRLQNQEADFDQVRQQLTDEVETQKDYTRAININLEGKIESLNQILQGVIADLKQLKNQANESVTILGQYKQKLSELEKILEAQNQHTINLEVALNSLVDVWQAKEAAASQIAASKSREVSNSKTYKVQSGDTLEKIARAHKVSVQILRDYNHLASDRIVVGQTLKIP